MHFASDDHRNHDHPISHVVTQVGSRLLQRMFPAGSTILDVFGNPNACDRFNKSQSKSKTPKFMMALVNKFGGMDFIRAANKWGPLFSEDGEARYLEGDLSSLHEEDVSNFTHFQLLHSLYYVKPLQLLGLMAKSKGSKALALIHRHNSDGGTINDGEQSYQVRNGIVKQRNVLTNTCYYHPNITPFWFREDKTWYPDEDFGFDSSYHLGLAWECHLVCQDTWIVEIVVCDRQQITRADSAMWDSLYHSADQSYEMSRKNDAVCEPATIIPTADGKFVELTVTCFPMFEALRRQAVGRSRVGSDGRKLFDSLLSTAKHLNAPGELFPGKEGMPVDPGILIDHVLSAWVTDIQRETDLLASVNGLLPVFQEHASATRGGLKVQQFTLASLVSIVRGGLKAGIAVNRVARSQDVIGGALTHLDEALADA